MKRLFSISMLVFTLMGTAVYAGCPAGYYSCGTNLCCPN